MVRCLQNMKLMQRRRFHDSGYCHVQLRVDKVCLCRPRPRPAGAQFSEIQSSKYIAIADDLQGAGVRLEMMSTCFVSKLLLYYMIQCHAQGFGSCFKCWPFNDTFRDIFLYQNTDQPSKSCFISYLSIFIEAESAHN